ncbi:hypothetical protein DSECCO2_601370 [anaerobic digester metagenome]
MVPLGERGLDVLHGDAHQIADDGFDIPSDIPYFRVLGRFNLYERGVGQLCNTAGDLRLSHPGGTDHNDILWRNLVADLQRQTLAAGAVANGDCNRPLCLLLSDYVLIKLFHYFGRLEFIKLPACCICHRL